jgi:hypothetical protein
VLGVGHNFFDQSGSDLLISTARPLKYLNILLFKSYNNIISFLGGDCDGGDPGQALQYIAQSGIPDET